VEDVTATNGVAGDHRNHGLRQAPDLDLEVEHVQAARALRIDVAVLASDPLVAARAERLGPGSGEDDDPDPGIVPRDLEGSRHLEDSGWPERVSDLGPVDGDLGDAVPRLVDDVFVPPGASPPARPARCSSRASIFQAGTPRAITSTVRNRS
jgi:hypothetical protein